jgi:Cd2+/Zn2+-exporting ATPase
MEFEFLSIAAAIEKSSQHPLAAAIVNKANYIVADVSLEVEQFQSITGKGVKARINNEFYYIYWES